jgi:hypothetical protein
MRSCQLREWTLEEAGHNPDLQLELNLKVVESDRNQSDYPDRPAQLYCRNNLIVHSPASPYRDCRG